MKKTKTVSLVLFIGVVIILSSCASMIEKILPNEELIIAPDPENPFQGTWMSTFPSSGYMHVINGMNGEWYARVKKRSVNTWDKLAVYTIEESDNGYITSNNWRISVNDDVLAVEKSRYIRYDRYIGK